MMPVMLLFILLVFLLVLFVVVASTALPRRHDLARGLFGSVRGLPLATAARSPRFWPWGRRSALPLARPSETFLTGAA